MTQSILIVEVDNERNAGLFFLPLNRRLRGSLDARRTREKGAAEAACEWPGSPFPGQRLLLDAAKGTAALLEPLHDPENAKVAAWITERGYRLPPVREDFANVDVPTWAYHLRRAVEAGLVRIVSGTIPAVQGEPQTRFYGVEQQDPRDRQIADLVAQNNRLTAYLFGTLPAAQRARVEELLRPAGGKADA